MTEWTPIGRLAATIEDTRAACAQALASAGDGLPPAVVARVSAPDLAGDFAAGAAAADRAFQRLGLQEDEARATLARRALLGAAMHSLARLGAAPLSPAVKARCCRVFRQFCDRPRPADRRFRPDLFEESRALAACARLRRFPAGQLDWDVSGLPRSYVLKCRPADLPRVLRTIVFRLRGLRPCFTPHMGVGRYPLLFVEAESNRSYFRMAESMALQPAVKGLVMAAWYHSPETIRVSPHLAWTNATPLAHGAVLTEIGPAASDSGFLEGSDERRRLFECGAYRPTLGLVIWPRRDLLAWAGAHPEYGADAETG